MDPRIDDFLANAATFTGEVDSLPDWAAPSPCEGWSAGDVVDHVVDTERDFLHQRGAELPTLSGADPQARWHAHLDDVRRVTADEAFVTETYDGFFGPTTLADTLAHFYGFDLIVHRWDLGAAAGRDVRWTEGELSRIERALDGFGDHLYVEGVCRRAVPVPADAPRQDRLLGRMGRRPR